MYKPKKNTFADVQYIDVAGISGERKSGGLPPAFLNYIAQVDALLHVVRAFEDRPFRILKQASTRAATSRASILS